MATHCGRRNWNRAHQDRAAEKQGDEQAEMLSRVLGEVKQSQRGLDIEFLQRLHADPIIQNSPYHLDRVGRALRWLDKNPTRNLTPTYRDFMEKIFYRVNHARSKGLNFLVGPTPEQMEKYREKAKRMTALGKVRAEERIAKRPDWMRDPSKLPKKPPSSPKTDD